MGNFMAQVMWAEKELKSTGEGAKPSLRYSLNLSAHFRVWVTVWVKQLTHILTHTVFGVFATKKHRKPKFSMLFGAAGQIRTADLILTNSSPVVFSYSPLFCLKAWNPCGTRVSGFSLLYLHLPCFTLAYGLFDARMGFVWVLQRPIRGDFLTHSIVF